MISKSPDDFLLGAIIGSAIGVVAALILAPSSGEALRSKIAHGITSASKIGRKTIRTTGRAGIKSKLKNASAPVKKEIKRAVKPKPASKGRAAASAE